MRSITSSAFVPAGNLVVFSESSSQYTFGCFRFVLFNAPTLCFSRKCRPSLDARMFKDDWRRVIASGEMRYRRIASRDRCAQRRAHSCGIRNVDNAYGFNVTI